MMEHVRKPDISEIMDESRKIRPRFQPQDDSGWVPHGRYTILREDGSPRVEITYHYGVVHGPYLDYWKNGVVACEGQFQDGKQDGIWHFYNLDSTLMEIVRFDQGREIIDFPRLPPGVQREENKGGDQ